MSITLSPSVLSDSLLSFTVSDLPPYATEDDLCNVFLFPMDHLPGDALGRVYIYPFYVTEIRMVTGAGGTSKYAFVRFPSIAERTRALYIMQGVLCIGRPSQWQPILTSFCVYLCPFI